MMNGKKCEKPEMIFSFLKNVCTVHYFKNGIMRFTCIFSVSLELHSFFYLIPLLIV